MTTNSTILNRISDLKSDIEDQTQLINKLIDQKVQEEDLIVLLQDTEKKIEEMKEYQKILMNRNFSTIVKYKNQEISIANLIKLKESYILKKDLYQKVLMTDSENLHLLKIAFQKTQELKVDLNKIHSILSNFNTSQFEEKSHKDEDENK